MSIRIGYERAESPMTEPTRASPRSSSNDKLELNITSTSNESTTVKPPKLKKPKEKGISETIYDKFRGTSSEDLKTAAEELAKDSTFKGFNEIMRSKLISATEMSGENAKDTLLLFLSNPADRQVAISLYNQINNEWIRQVSEGGYSPIKLQVVGQIIQATYNTAEKAAALKEGRTKLNLIEFSIKVPYKPMS